MKLRGFLAIFCLVFVLVPAAQAQVSPDKAESTFTVSDGLEIKLWASEPLFVNPTCMDIDHRGRVWVCESVNYRHSLHHRPPLRPEGDRIVILEDSTGSGRADKATTFYQSKEMLAPMGIAVAKDPIGPGYKVYVCQSPDILLFEDKDGDGKADGPPKKLLSGFRGIDHDHGVHGILIGPDMRLYFSVGDQGVSGLVDKHGKKWTTNHSDCQAGTIWRCDLDGQNLELLAHNFRNEYEPCVDSFGTIFVSDNDDDGNEQTRICYVMPGGNYGYWPRGPGQSHWHEEQPGVVPKILRTYFGSPTGMCVYEGSLLPPKYQGQLLHTDAGPRQLRCYHLTPDGAGYEVAREDMVNSTDNWFRPSDVCVAPDGSVFISDWYDPGVGGHGMGDTTRGRIYRIAPRGVKPSVPNVDLENREGWVQALASPAQSLRYMAMARLNSMDAKKAKSVLSFALEQKSNPFLRARTLWQLENRYFRDRETEFELHSLSGETLQTAVTDRDPRFRQLAVRLGMETLKNLIPQPRARPAVGLWRVAVDPNVSVRRELLLALQDFGPEEARPLIVDLAKQYDGKDRFYLAAIGIAVGTDESRREVILEDFDKQFRHWNDRTADLVWELRPPEILRTLHKRLNDDSLPVSQQTRIVDIIATGADVGAGKRLLTLLSQRVPAEVRDRVVERIAESLPGKWRSLRESEDLTEAIRHLLARTDTRTLALKLIAASPKAAWCEQVIRVAGDRTESEPARLSALETLGELPCPAAIAELVNIVKNVGPSNSLHLKAVAALGKHADSQGETAKPALVALRQMLLEKSIEVSLQQASLGALAGTRAGSIWLLEAQARKELPGSLALEAGRLLRNSPYQDLRNRALIAFPVRRLNPSDLPRIEALATRRGNVARGKQLIHDSIRSEIQCLKCHTIAGEGGKIGPDLSAIGKKASRENLLESILQPSKAIADQYVTWLVGTSSGLVVSGLLVEETADSIMLRDANGKDTKVNKKEIETRTKSPTSIMPADLLAYMTEDDLLDIVEYLLELKSAN
jgi:putative membrane-bound dehydrogenase-like protein